MKLEKFTKNKKKRNTLLTLGMLLVILGGGIILYRSYALYQEEKSFNVLEGKVGEFNAGDIQLAFTIDGVETTDIFPEQSSNYTDATVTCENGATAGWNIETWSLTNIKSNGNKKIKCTIDFIPKILCRRATTLHTETCDQTSTSNYCGADGYAEGDTITYGTLGTSGILTVGDAFDCDVNGDGTYDATTERFYYVSDYYETETNEFNSKYATLIYYNKVNAGVADNTSMSAYDNLYNYYGPVSAIKQLPTTSQWSNISLKTTTRIIRNESGGSTTYNGTYNLPTAFSYSGYAARMITYQEIEQGCYDGTTLITSNGGLSSKCQFLLENTLYSSSSTYSGYWLETPNASSSNTSWNVNGYRLGTMSVNYMGNPGVRPTIEVAKTNISY